jgi:hypothetical protein
MNRARIAALSTLGALLLALYPGSSGAIPAFARKTGMGCPACHDAWPRLNDFGENYRDRGYRTNNWNNETWNKLLDTVPFSFRTTPVYQYASTTNQVTDSGTRTIGSGGFAVPSADIYVGSAVSHHVSTYIDLSGFGPDGAVSMESAWLRLNDLGTDWVNVKFGKMELDLPESMHRAFTLFSPILVYGYHPTGSANTYMMMDNQYGVELSGHAAGPGLRYNAAFTTGNDVQTANLFSAPLAYAHVNYTYLTGSPVVSRVRGGVFGLVGWRPTASDTSSATGTPVPVPGTWGASVPHSRIGADLHMTFGSPSTPLTLSAAWMWGQEDTGLIANATQAGVFHGGLIQVDYVPNLSWVFGVRYDGAYNILQGDTSQPADSNEQTAFTAFARYMLWTSVNAGLALHFEASTLQTQNANPNGLPVRANTLFVGADFLL